jgi:hypothetical protein
MLAHLCHILLAVVAPMIHSSTGRGPAQHTAGISPTLLLLLLLLLCLHVTRVLLFLLLLLQSLRCRRVRHGGRTPADPVPLLLLLLPVLW